MSANTAVPVPRYTPGVSGPRQHGLIELASNENPSGPSPLAIAAGQAGLRSSHQYPDHDAGFLKAGLAEHWELPADRVVVTAGTTALIDLVARCFLGPETRAVASERSFLAYTTSTWAAGSTLDLAPMRGDCIDLDAVLAAIRPETRVVFLANPNNPTGTAFDHARFASFLERVPAEVLVVLDEAYAEYGHALPDTAALLRSARPPLVLRTFSKVYGLAGLRVGYALGATPVIRALADRVCPFAVSGVAQASALAALRDSRHVRTSVSANEQNRRALTDGLVALGLAPARSAANFVYVDLGRPSGPVRDHLLQSGVRVRALTDWGARTALRITVGRHTEVITAVRALSLALAAPPTPNGECR
jgi:histidinol-phosphate aminotransferase